MTIRWLDLAHDVFGLVGVLAFAVSGALQAVEKRMDIVGVLSLAIVTAVGGGLLRDLLVGAVPQPRSRTPPSCPWRWPVAWLSLQPAGGFGCRDARCSCSTRSASACSASRAPPKPSNSA
ncbi:MAG: TRIC cation channel family protein [Actinomycetales bacterium]|nr:TRIC cation channel family protein [Actinomycetales bacterium]